MINHIFPHLCNLYCNLFVFFPQARGIVELSSLRSGSWVLMQTSCWIQSGNWIKFRVRILLMNNSQAPFARRSMEAHHLQCTFSVQKDTFLTNKEHWSVSIHTLLLCTNNMLICLFSSPKSLLINQAKGKYFLIPRRYHLRNVLASFKLGVLETIRLFRLFWWKNCLGVGNAAIHIMWDLNAARYSSMQETLVFVEIRV